MSSEHPELTAALGAEQFLREIAVTARFDHPHILTLIDSGEAGGIPFYVVPYAGGGERLFEGVDLRRAGYACVECVASERAAHVALRRQPPPISSTPLR